MGGGRGGREEAGTTNKIFTQVCKIGQTRSGVESGKAI